MQLNNLLKKHSLGNISIESATYMENIPKQDEVHQILR